jgi:hypothetical protein
MEDYPDPVSCGYEVFEMQVKADLAKKLDQLAEFRTGGAV